MDQNMNNTGSFGAALGGVDALKAEMEKRGLDASVLNQISPAAAGEPSPTPPQIQGQPQEVGAAQSVLQPETQIDPDVQIAAEALSGVVKTNNKIKEAKAGLR